MSGQTVLLLFILYELDPDTLLHHRCVSRWRLCSITS